MTDKNNVEIKAGDIVEITGAYFKNDNALYFVEHIPGDPGWIGGDICLHMIGKSGKLSSAKYATAFWPLKAYVSNRVKAAQARIWNKEHAQIEVRTDIDQSFVAEWFRKAADDLSVTIEWNKLHFGEDCQDVKRELKTEAHLRAVAARLSGNVRSLHFIGTDDFEICKKIFLYAYNCIVSTCKREIERNPWDDRGTYRKAVNAYGWGFCEGLRDAFEAQKEEHQEWGLVMVTPQAVVEEADGLGKPRAIGRNEVDMDTLGARQKGYRDGLKFDPNSRLEGRPERAQLASCR